MIVLASIMGPELGLFFWTALIFLIFFFLLRRFAWKPILSALNAREASIEASLSEAKAAKEEMAKLKADNEALLKEARVERDKIIQDANAMADRIVKEARDAAAEAGAKERDKAKQQIEAEKLSALAEIKDTAASLAVEVAEKILRAQFEDPKAQEAFARKVIADLNQN
ncbi:MAG: ATP synthase F0 subunit B [Bacteroidetes bacterium]|nr:MAG: ATP synthase F0 subunit B [Bacteroidota bacterium]